MLWATSVLFFFVARGVHPALAADSPPAAPSVLSPGHGQTSLGDDIEIHEIAPLTWRYVTWFDLPPYGRTPANGLLVVSGRTAILVNTGWTDDQAARLAGWVEGTIGAHIDVVVPTHAHADTIGGLAALHRRGATSWAQEQTISIARSSGQEVPRHGFDRAKELRVGDRVVKLAFHGAGHTPDSIVVWLPAERILFGGCLVKSASSKDLRERRGRQARRLAGDDEGRARSVSGCTARDTRPWRPRRPPAPRAHARARRVRPGADELVECPDPGIVAVARRRERRL